MTLSLLRFFSIFIINHRSPDLGVRDFSDLGVRVFRFGGGDGMDDGDVDGGGEAVVMSMLVARQVCVCVCDGVGWR